MIQGDHKNRFTECYNLYLSFYSEEGITIQVKCKFVEKNISAHIKGDKKIKVLPHQSDYEIEQSRLLSQQMIKRYRASIPQYRLDYLQENK